MADKLLGKEVNAKLNEELKIEVDKLNAQEIYPTLAIVRVGENESDMSYERGAIKKCELLGIKVEKFVQPEDITQECMLQLINNLNNDSKINAVLLLRPLPKHLNQQEIENALSPKKDVDCMTESSIGSIFTGKKVGFPPCTPHACMKILEHYNIDITGKKVVILGRSLVVGKPLAMMMLAKNATVTMCHTKTNNLQEETKRADILVVAAGHKDTVTKDFVREGQIVIDVGINVDENGKLCGDVAFDEVSDIVSKITPVPGGVGSVTTTVLAEHVITACKQQNL